jgi:hypothetical protein
LKSTVRSNRVAAQAFEQDSGGKNRILGQLIVPLRIRQKTGAAAHDDVEPAAFLANVFTRSSFPMLRKQTRPQICNCPPGILEIPVRVVTARAPE